MSLPKIPNVPPRDNNPLRVIEIYAKLYNYFTIYMNIWPQEKYRGWRVVFPSKQTLLDHIDATRSIFLHLPRLEVQTTFPSVNDESHYPIRFGASMYLKISFLLLILHTMIPSCS